MAERQVYILLTDTGTFLTRTIKLFTRKKYNHASIAFDDRLSETYSFGRKNPGNPFIAGFIQENIASSFYKKTNCVLYSLNVTAVQLAEMQATVLSFEAQKETYHYNLLGLLAVLLKKEWTRENYYFCSQFVAEVLEKGSVFESPKPFALMEPEDIVANLSVEKTYEGNIKKYMQAFTELDLEDLQKIEMLTFDNIR